MDTATREFHGEESPTPRAENRLKPPPKQHLYRKLAVNGDMGIGNAPRKSNQSINNKVNEPARSVAGTNTTDGESSNQPRLGNPTLKREPNKRSRNLWASILNNGKFSDRSSFKSSTEVITRLPPQLENTYKMAPDRVVSALKVEQIIQNVLEQNLRTARYDPVVMGDKARALSEIIKQKVKDLKYERYRIISWVMILEKGNNSIKVASRGLWDSSCDGSISSEFRNETLHAVGTVHTVYLE